MDTELHASVATFRVYTSGPRARSASRSEERRSQAPPSRADRMAATPVTEGPLMLSRLATNEMSYLQVSNFTRAVMPRSYIWRVSDTELVVPASFTNYWLITLSGSHQAVLKLDKILRCLCKYEVLGEEDIEEPLETCVEPFEGPVDGPAETPIEDAADENKLSHDPSTVAKLPRESDSITLRKPTFSGNSEHRAVQQIAANEPALAAANKVSATVIPDTVTGRGDLSPRPQRTEAAGQTIDGFKAGNPATKISSALTSPPASPPASPGADATDTSLNYIASPRKVEASDRATQNQKVRLITPPEIENVKLFMQADASETPSVQPAPGSPAQICAPGPGPQEDFDGPLAKESYQRESPEPYEDLLLAFRNHSLQKSLDTRFGPRFSHPLIPSSHIDYAYPSAVVYTPTPHRVALQRRELLAVGPHTLHQEVTTVGGYIGLKTVNRFLRKT